MLSFGTLLYVIQSLGYEKKNLGEIGGCCENAHGKSFETSPHMISLALSLASRSLWSYHPIPMTQDWGHKDLEAKGQLYQVGTHFEALFTGVLTAASTLPCIFFCILTSGLEQCEGGCFVGSSGVCSPKSVKM